MIPSFIRFDPVLLELSSSAQYEDEIGDYTVRLIPTYETDQGYDIVSFSIVEVNIYVHNKLTYFEPGAYFTQRIPEI